MKKIPFPDEIYVTSEQIEEDCNEIYELDAHLEEDVFNEIDTGDTVAIYKLVRVGKLKAKPFIVE